MNQEQRIELLELQRRSYTEGTVEYINHQWVFFDHETEEASALDDWTNKEIEVFRLKRWRKGTLQEDGKLNLGKEFFLLKDQDMVRIRKNLVFSLERLLQEVNDDAFFQFVTNLNSMNFSVYDCIYCYNHLTFFDDSSQKSGVNFIVFDNEDTICSVHHHFYYYKNTSDRFEFTLSTGKRMVIEKIG